MNRKCFQPKIYSGMTCKLLPKQNIIDIKDDDINNSSFLIIPVFCGERNPSNGLIFM